MTDSAMSTRAKVEKSMKKRRAAESRFRTYGLLSVLFGVLCLVVLFGNIFSKGFSAFSQTVLTTTIHLDTDYLGVTATSDPQELRNADYEGLIKQYLKDTYEPSGRRERRDLYGMVSVGAAWQLQDMVLENPSLLGQTIHINMTMDDDVDQWFKHTISVRRFFGANSSR